MNFKGKQNYSKKKKYRSNNKMNNIKHKLKIYNAII